VCAYLLWLTLLGFFLLAYVYYGYAIVLRLLSSRRSPPTFPGKPEEPSVTVLITVYNEVEKIQPRILNVLACDYPKDRFEILVASDGSTDGTDDRARHLRHPAVRVFRPAQRLGKTDTQNQAIAAAKGQIIVFTDADTRFSREFLKEIVRPFADPRVGGVDGHLLFEGVKESKVSQSQGTYWSQELAIRAAESSLGILGVASGACMAVRRSLFRTMKAAVGEDCLVPLDVVDQGYRMVHAEQAVAWDQMPERASGEFKTRVRMTQRNWQGTLAFPQLLNPFKNPGIAFALWSHKILRWLSPVFLGVLTLSSWLTGSGSPLELVIAFCVVLFYLVGAAGALAYRNGWQIPIAGTVFSFLLANAGFLCGVWNAMFGKAITTYR
jgi:cellulose synthase/poly-beta-1,6-N-acetylglucosamine synthase-like glycosyltransferase